MYVDNIGDNGVDVFPNTTMLYFTRCPAQTHGGDDCLIWDVDDVVTCGPIDPTE